MVDLIVVFIWIFIVAFIVVTAQLAAAKNKFDFKWNNKFGHRFGDWCYLCVGFWLGVLITIIIAFFTGLSLGQALLIIFAQPAISTFITLKIL